MGDKVYSFCGTENSSCAFEHSHIILDIVVRRQNTKANSISSKVSSGSGSQAVSRSKRGQKTKYKQLKTIQDKGLEIWQAHLTGR